MEQKEYIGYKSTENVRAILKNGNFRNIFLVTGNNSYEICGAKAALDNILQNYEVVRFSEFQTNPKLEDIERGLELFKEQDPDVVIAVGGGTVIDVAKLINIFANKDWTPREYVFKDRLIDSPGKPLIAIPTTSGGGSEATHFAVVYVDGVKYSVAHKHILPKYSIIDPEFTMNLPVKITASTGMDALAQAIESYWCINSTEESKAYASQAIRLVMANFREAINNASKTSREAMAVAANLAGKAINISKTTAPHAISYPITYHFGIPHGHAVSLSLASVLEYNYQISEKDTLDIRGAAYVRQKMNEIIELLGATNVEGAKNEITKLMKDIGLETKLSELGIFDRDIIIKEGFNPDRVKNNPRKITEAALRGILDNIS